MATITPTTEEPLYGDFSVKLNFKGDLTVETIIDALHGMRILVGKSKSVINDALQIDLDFEGLAIETIEAGSFKSVAKVILDGSKKLAEVFNNPNMALGKTITICTAGLLICGAGAWTFYKMTQSATGSVEVGDNNSGFVGNNNTGNVINIFQDGSLSGERLASIMKQKYPEDEVLCDKLAESIVNKMSPTFRNSLMKATVKLRAPGGKSVDSIIVAPDAEGTQMDVTSIIDADALKDVPNKYEAPKKMEEKRLVSDVLIDIQRINKEAPADKAWGAKVVDEEIGLPNRTLPFIVDNEDDRQRILNSPLSKPFRIDMYAVFVRDKNGNPDYKRYVLKDFSSAK